MQSTSINPTWLCSLCEELEETKASKPTSSRTKSVAKERPPSQVAGHPRSPQKAPGQVLNLFIAWGPNIPPYRVLATSPYAWCGTHIMRAPQRQRRGPMPQDHAVPRRIQRRGPSRGLALHCVALRGGRSWNGSTASPSTARTWGNTLALLWPCQPFGDGGHVQANNKINWDVFQ